MALEVSHHQTAHTHTYMHTYPLRHPFTHTSIHTCAHTYEPGPHRVQPAAPRTAQPSQAVVTISHPSPAAHRRTSVGLSCSFCSSWSTPSLCSVTPRSLPVVFGEQACSVTVCLYARACLCLCAPAYLYTHVSVCLCPLCLSCASLCLCWVSGMICVSSGVGSHWTLPELPLPSLLPSSHLPTLSLFFSLVSGISASASVSSPHHPGPLGWV